MAKRFIPSINRDRLFHFNYEKKPNPINVTTLIPTTTFADSKSNHPFHIKTIRRLAQFDPTKLHWTVTSNVDLSKSALVRKTAARRVREAFRQELRLAGWKDDGRRRPEGGPDGTVRTFDLSGALRLHLTKEAFAITATSEEVRQSASFAVKKLSELHSKDKQQYKRPTRQFPGRNGSDDYARSEDTQSAPIRRISHR
ncbi:hypothetical protein MBLNU13_g07681t1 [Cladosporium sp. NU13]